MNKISREEAPVGCYRLSTRRHRLAAATPGSVFSPHEEAFSGKAHLASSQFLKRALRKRRSGRDSAFVHLLTRSKNMQHATLSNTRQCSKSAQELQKFMGALISFRNSWLVMIACFTYSRCALISGEYVFSLSVFLELMNSFTRKFRLLRQVIAFYLPVLLPARAR